MDAPGWIRRTLSCACALGLATAGWAAGGGAQDALYRVEPQSTRVENLRDRFSDGQLALLEKLNRADIEHLESLPQLVVPMRWNDELDYSVLPRQYAPAGPHQTFLVVYLPGQLFGAYEFGSLVRWGPVSTGRRSSPTRAGAFSLNWRSTGRTSTVDPDWFMRWYFNFDSREGLALHEYTLPGYPASHGCIRLLERDAIWLFDWGQGWTLDSNSGRVVRGGTPMLIVGQYNFDEPPPWRSTAWLTGQVDLPAADSGASARW